MSRSGYVEYCDHYYDQWAHIRYRGAVKSAIRGKRGQALLRDLVAALDAMPKRELIANELVTANGEMCALGALGVARAMDMTRLDPEDIASVAEAFGVNEKLIREIVWENDEAWGCRQSPAMRWKDVRDWAASMIKEPEIAG